MKQRKPTPPDLWWSPTLGLITHTEPNEFEEDPKGVYWQLEAGQTSLRHKGLPNEVPADATPLIPGPGPEEDLFDDEDRKVYIHELIVRRWIHGNHEAKRALVYDVQYNAEMTVLQNWLQMIDESLWRIGWGLNSRDEVLRVLVFDGLPGPSVGTAVKRREEHLKRVATLKQQEIKPFSEGA
jgi:hypothetical protein